MKDERRRRLAAEFLESSATVVDPFEPIDRALDRSQKTPSRARRRGGRRADPRSARHGQDHRGGRRAGSGSAPGPVLRRVQRCCDALVERLLRSDFADADSQSGASSGPERGGSSSRKGALFGLKIKKQKRGKRTLAARGTSRNPDPPRAPRVCCPLCSTRRWRLRSRSDDSALARPRCARPAPAAGEADVARAPNGAPRGGSRRVQKETKARQKKAVSVVVSHANIVCCALSGSPANAIRNETFDVVVIDGGAGARASVLGRHVQARSRCWPGTTCSSAHRGVHAAAKGGLATTLFARAHLRWPEAAVMLTTQYRMHASIAQWASDELLGEAGRRAVRGGAEADVGRRARRLYGETERSRVLRGGDARSEKCLPWRRGHDFREHRCVPPRARAGGHRGVRHGGAERGGGRQHG